MVRIFTMDKKTNATRKLDMLKIPYKEYFYSPEDAVTGTDVAALIGQNPEHVFKTLVTTGKSNIHYVFMIPVGKELDLKKAAAAVNEKNIIMLKSKELLPLTGYIHGGCSPIGMKKLFRTIIDNSAEEFDTIICSGGKRGYQIEITLSDLRKAVAIDSAAIV